MSKKCGKVSSRASKMNYSSSGFRSLPAQLSATKSVPNLPFATSLLHRIGENVGETLTKNNNKKPNLKSKQQLQPNFILQGKGFLSKFLFLLLLLYQTSAANESCLQAYFLPWIASRAGPGGESGGIYNKL